MSGRHGRGTGPVDDAADRAVDARLQDYGDRWRSATALLERAEADETHVAALVDLGADRRRRRTRETALVAMAVASVVVVVVGVFAGVTLLRSATTPSTAPASGSTDLPSATPTGSLTVSSAGRFSVTYAPAAPIARATVVTVTARGFDAGAPVAIAVCPADRTLLGPGDCGRAKDHVAVLATASADGVATATITVPVGPLRNLTPPAVSCGPTHACVIDAVDISQASQHAAIAVLFRP